MSNGHLPYGHHSIDESDIQAVVDVLRSDRVTQGPAVEAFEVALGDFCGAAHVVAVSSGTAALHLACLAAGLKTGDELVTSPLTFVASANCALYCGARPRFVDIDANTLNLSPDGLETLLQGQEGKARVKVALPVHFGGLPSEMERIEQIARTSGATIIEDASHALGSKWQDTSGTWHRVGSCSHSDMAVLSFHPVKHITSGEGGAILTNDAELFEKVKDLRTHGIVKDAERLGSVDGPWYYEMQELGYNYRISDIQCALGESQLKKIAGWVDRRRAIASRYEEAFECVDDVETGIEPSWARSAHHLFVILVSEQAPFGRKALYEELHKRDIGVQVHYVPVHLQPYYREHFGFSEGDFPVAEDYYNRCLSLPIYPTLSDEEVDRVIDSVHQSIAACRQAA
jgi:perosamine synthetase